MTDNGSKTTAIDNFRDVLLHLFTQGIEPRTCYSAANHAAQHAEHEYLCFPSDDSYYTPDFAETMLMCAERYSLELVYCDMLDKRRRGFYEVWNVEPRVGQIDKTGFIIRTELFRKLGGFPIIKEPWADGLLIEAAIKAGAKHAKAPGIMVVHS